MSASDDRADEARAIRRRLVRRVGSLEHVANCLRGAYMPGPDLTGGERDAIDALARRFELAAAELGPEVEAADEAVAAAEASVDAEEAA